MQSTGTYLQNRLHARARLGEGPIWDDHHQVLYWVDIYNCRVHRFTPATGENRFVELDTVVTGLCLTYSDRLLVGQRDGLAALNFTTGEVTPIVAIEADRPNNRLNDMKCDPQGRLWVGTMNNDEQPTANLYRYDLDGGLHLMETGLTISNGLGWSPDGTTFYLTDTPRQRIDAYNYDPASGSISYRRPLIQLEHLSLFPDGLTVDAEGCIWSAMWNGGCVIRFDAEGREMLRIPLPVPLVTSCTFGGTDLQELFITTASVGLSQAAIQRHLQSGDVFSLRTQVRGLTGHRYGGPG